MAFGHLPGKTMLLDLKPDGGEPPAAPIPLIESRHDGRGAVPRLEAEAVVAGAILPVNVGHASMV
jgi:hypothetical protein